MLNAPQEEDEDGPGEPPLRVEHPERHEEEECHPTQSLGAASSEKRIGDVSPIELADRNQVESGHKETEPPGEAQRRERHDVGGADGGAVREAIEPRQEN